MGEEAGGAHERNRSVSGTCQGQGQVSERSRRSGIGKEEVGNRSRKGHGQVSDRLRTYQGEIGDSLATTKFFIITSSDDSHG